LAEGATTLPQYNAKTPPAQFAARVIKKAIPRTDTRQTGLELSLGE